MRVLLDTNILIHREASTVVRHDIGKLFFWLDKLKHEKCIHPASLEEIDKHKDQRVRDTFRAKLQSYHVLKTTAPVSAAVQTAAVVDDRVRPNRNARSARRPRLGEWLSGRATGLQAISGLHDHLPTQHR